MTQAISAVFHNARRIPTRKAYQLLLEVPEEQQALVHEVLGYPNSSTSIWVGIARMQEPGQPRQDYEAREPDGLGE